MHAFYMWLTAGFIYFAYRFVRHKLYGRKGDENTPVDDRAYKDRLQKEKEREFTKDK
jgi:hypothetical protein